MQLGLSTPSAYTLALGTAKRAYRKYQTKVLRAHWQVLYDEGGGFAYVPIPKVACTSLKWALLSHINAKLHAESGRIGKRDVHAQLVRRSLTQSTENRLRNFDGFKFAVIRHPVGRLVSCYVNRILDRKDLETGPTRIHLLERAGLPLRPDLDTFARNLSVYSASNPSIAHHVRPQSRFVIQPGLFDRIYMMNELDALAEDLANYCGVELKLEKENASRGEKPNLSSEARLAVEEYYAADFEMFSDRF